VRTGKSLETVCLTYHWPRNALLGPGEITIFHPEAYEAMDGPQNLNTRSDWYDLLHPRISSIFTRDKKLHNERRKMWEQALSTKGGNCAFHTRGQRLILHTSLTAIQSKSHRKGPHTREYDREGGIAPDSDQRSNVFLRIRFNGRFRFQWGLRHDAHETVAPIYCNASIGSYAPGTN
jgi:hypothetical protein